MKVLLEAIVGCECTVMSCRAIVGSGDDHAGQHFWRTCDLAVLANVAGVASGKWEIVEGFFGCFFLLWFLSRLVQ